MVEQIVVEEVKEEAPKKGEGEEEEEEAEEQPPENEEEAKVPKWNPKDFKWTITNGHAKNLPQLFRDYMRGRGQFEEKDWKTFQSNTHNEAAMKALDEFCQKVAEESNNQGG